MSLQRRTRGRGDVRLGVLALLLATALAGCAPARAGADANRVAREQGVEPQGVRVGSGDGPTTITLSYRTTVEPGDQAPQMDRIAAAIWQRARIRLDTLVLRADTGRGALPDKAYSRVDLLQLSGPRPVELDEAGGVGLFRDFLVTFLLVTLVVVLVAALLVVLLRVRRRRGGPDPDRDDLSGLDRPPAAPPPPVAYGPPGPPGVRAEPIPPVAYGSPGPPGVRAEPGPPGGAQRAGASGQPTPLDIFNRPAAPGPDGPLGPDEGDGLHAPLVGTVQPPAVADPDAPPGPEQPPWEPSNAAGQEGDRPR
jgi:hypothetical protein